MITEDIFGFLNGVGEIHRFSITNCFGETLELLDYGASIHSLRLQRAAGPGSGEKKTAAAREGCSFAAGSAVPSFDGFDDVVLGGPDADSLDRPCYEGVTIGRVANRIKDGRCTVFGAPLQLECNWRGNFMHGASGNYAKKLFRADYAAGNNFVTMRLHDDGAGGFGNEVETAVTFTWNDARQLVIHYEMTAGGDTLLCPTNHTYWDLSGRGDLGGQSLRVNAKEIARKDETGVPTGEKMAVAGTVYDFRKATPLREVFTPPEEIASGAGALQIDDTYLLSQGADFAAELSCPGQGRRLRVITDMPAVVVFTPYARQPRDGKTRQYTGYCGVALETQFVPNAVNLPGFAAPVFRAGQTLVTETVFEFS